MFAGNWSEGPQLGIPILKSTWVDVDKGDSLAPNYRSRFVAMEFNFHGVREDGQ